MRHRVRTANNLSFVKDTTDGFRGYILQDDVIKLDVLGINSDGSLDVYAFRPIPEFKIEVNRLYCFAADLKSFTPY
jgi:hypothetical protein